MLIRNNNEESLRRDISDHGVTVIDIPTLIAANERIPREPLEQLIQFEVKPHTTARLIRDMFLIPAGAIIPAAMPFALKAYLAVSGDYDLNHTAYDINNNMTGVQKAFAIVYAVSTVGGSSFIIFHSSLPSLRYFKNQTLRADCIAPLRKTAYAVTSVTVSFALALSPDNILAAVFSMLSLPTFFFVSNVVGECYWI